MKPPYRLRSVDIKPWRIDNKPDICPLLGIPLSQEDAVVDHDHKTGKVRGVVHRQGNALMGKVENYYLRFMAKLDVGDLRQVLIRIVEWMETNYDHMPLHPDGAKKLVSQFRARKAKDQETFLEAVGIDPAKTGVERTKQFRAWLMR